MNQNNNQRKKAFRIFPNEILKNYMKFEIFEA